jgi:[CysO sulfur-carrier protein]-S-L-cysteine hydrolase
VKLGPRFRDAIVKQALDEVPLECCGFLGGRDGIAQELYPLTNVERSPVLYRADSAEMFRAIRDMEERDLELVAIYHSHTRSPAYPSSTDVAQAYYPDAVYLIVSLRDRDRPDLRGFTIRDAKVEEVSLDD